MLAFPGQAGVPDRQRLDKGANQSIDLGGFDISSSIISCRTQPGFHQGSSRCLRIPSLSCWLPTGGVILTGRPCPAEWELGRHTSSVHREETLCDGAAEKHLRMNKTLNLALKPRLGLVFLPERRSVRGRGDSGKRCRNSISTSVHSSLTALVKNETFKEKKIFSCVFYNTRRNPKKT